MINFNILQTYFIRNVENHTPTIKTITLSFNVTNFQTISKLSSSNLTYVYESKHVQIYRAHIKMTQEHILREYLRKKLYVSIFRQTKHFGAKSFQKIAK